jgi:colanic acid/amylovoran biosynthesis glycosyltransferase
MIGVPVAPRRGVPPRAELRAAPVKLAYLCAQYPAVSHTFVLREVEALRRRGVEIATFSIRRAGAEHLLSRADRAAFESTYAILPARWGALLAAHLRLVRSAPRTYFSTLALALGLAPPGLRGRLWQVFYFVESVVLWRECRAREIRHTHVHLANVAADVALLAAHIGSLTDPQRPWSWSFTMHGPTEFADVGLHRLASKVQRARFVVCISDYARSQLMTLCDPDMWGKLHVLHVGIPIEQFTRTDADRSRSGQAPQSASADPTVLFIGRQVPEKGQGVLLQAAALLAARGRKVKLTLAGEGPARAAFEALAQRLGLAEQVSFPGAVGQEEIHALYADAAVFCLPSFAEGIPGVLMEAMAMEVPVLSTRITGIPELIEDGHNGLLVAPGRADELADALERLLADPALCRELGARGRARVLAQFNTTGSAEQLHDLLVHELAPASLQRRGG